MNKKEYSKLIAELSPEPFYDNPMFHDDTQVINFIGTNKFKKADLDKSQIYDLTQGYKIWNRVILPIQVQSKEIEINTYFTYDSGLDHSISIPRELYKWLGHPPKKKEKISITTASEVKLEHEQTEIVLKIGDFRFKVSALISDCTIPIIGNALIPGVFNLQVNNNRWSIEQPNYLTHNIS